MDKRDAHPKSNKILNAETPAQSDSTSNDATLTLVDAANRLGVHYMTAYRYVRLGQLPAHKLGGLWRVRSQDLNTFQQDEPISAVAFGETELKLEFEEALLGGDEPAAWHIAQRMQASGSSPSEIYLKLFSPTLVKIGKLWETGRISVAQEHLATSVVARLIGRLGSAFNHAGRKTGKVIIGAPQGDLHAIPSALFADLVRSHGVDVVDLGADTPAVSFLEVIRRHDGKVCLCLTSTHETSKHSITALTSDLKQLWPRLPIGVGGRSVASRKQSLLLGGTFWEADPVAAAASAARYAREIIR